MIPFFEFSPWLSWILPLIGAILTPLMAKINHKIRDYMAVTFTFLGALMALLIVFAYPDFTHGVRHAGHYPLSFNWIEAPGVIIKAGVIVDSLSVVMANVVAWLGFVIMVYSIAYMRGDEGLTRYWFFMNLFIGNMLLLVMSENFIQFLVGWKGVGLCSYALIGFWYKDKLEDRNIRWVGEGKEEYSPSHCGMKAFITTSVGDVFMLIAVFLIFSYSGTFSFIELQENLGWATDLARSGLLIPVAILILFGPFGKSAQFPFMEWLPDAMAGPTSVSALIHAATMVKAGVYFVARVFPIFYSAMNNGVFELIIFFEVVMWVGAITTFLAAIQAMVSREIKKVWAYSTASQIGYMMLALGVAGFLTGDALVAAFTAAIFHLISHAVFKTTLFLSSGAVVHSCHSRFIRDYGGLRRYMPITFISMTIGALSLAGLPPLGGFWSKEAVLKSAFEAMGLYDYAVIPFILASITVAVTIFYSVRAVSLTFVGRRERNATHEAEPLMWVPYALCASITMVIGILSLLNFENLLHQLYDNMIKPSSILALTIESPYAIAGKDFIVPLMSALLLIIGGLPAYYIYITRKINPESILAKNSILIALRNLILNRLYLNQFYYMVFVNRILHISQTCYRAIELKIIDGLNYFIANRIIAAFNHIRKTHTGVTNDYVVATVGGLIIIVLIILLLT